MIAAKQDNMIAAKQDNMIAAKQDNMIAAKQDNMIAAKQDNMKHRNYNCYIVLNAFSQFISGKCANVDLSTIFMKATEVM